MDYRLDDPIAAIASPPGGAARGIVRCSGPGVLNTLGKSFRAARAHDWRRLSAATAFGGEFQLDAFASPLPCRLYLWPTARSYTRQPLFELHTLGSPPLLEAVLAHLCARGARPAAPGEFTLRAFLAGRLDLTQAEAVLGVIDAADPGQLHAALAQLAGGLAAPLTRLRDELLDLLAHLEAGLDFVEEDIQFIEPARLQQQIHAAAETVADLARRTQSRHASDTRPRVPLLGAPNVGKSSLFNALTAGQAAPALVSPAAGTTRDYLQADLDLDGVGCLLIDTAGQQAAAPSPIDDAAQRQARGQQQHAPLRLLCLDATRPLNRWERATLAAAAPDDLLVLTRCDLLERQRSPALATAPRSLAAAVRTSSRTGAGLPALRRLLRARLEELASAGGDVVAATAVRSAGSLRAAADALQEALALARDQAGEELVAAQLRVALEHLGYVVGAVYTDDILDRIFTRFCVGK